MQRAPPERVPPARPRSVGRQEEEEQRGDGCHRRQRRQREPRRLLLLGRLLRPLPHVDQLSDGSLEAATVTEKIEQKFRNAYFYAKSDTKRELETYDLYVCDMFNVFEL